MTAVAVVMMSLTASAYQDGNGGSSFHGSAESAPVAVNNVQPVTVDYGPTTSGHLAPYPNALFTTVTVCVPGTSTCQNIDHVLVDTGSVGLRLLSSQVTLTLPYSKDASNNSIGNCAQFANYSYMWGPVAKADVKLAGEVASAVPIQVVGVASFPDAPFDCSDGDYFYPAQDVSELGFNGILGVGLLRQDCGTLCSSGTSIPAYWSCTPSACTIASADLTSQLQNPVWMFPQDNNGFSIVLPQVVATGSTALTGSMIFGIGTQSNNALNGAVAFGTDQTGAFTTTFKGNAYPGSFIDSGSNANFFLGSMATGLPECSGIFVGLYCPQSPVNFTAVNSGLNPNGSGVSVSSSVDFTIANGASLLNSVLPSAQNPVPETAFNDLGGDGFFPAFDWGLPFFFGRTVFFGIEGQSSAAGTGPYVATLSPDCSYQLSASGEAFPRWRHVWRNRNDYRRGPTGLCVGGRWKSEFYFYCWRVVWHWQWHDYFFDLPQHRRTRPVRIFDHQRTDFHYRTRIECPYRSELHWFDGASCGRGELDHDVHVGQQGRGSGSSASEFFPDDIRRELRWHALVAGGFSAASAGERSVLGQYIRPDAGRKGFADFRERGSADTAGSVGFGAIGGDGGGGWIRNFPSDSDTAGSRGAAGNAQREFLFIVF